MTEMDAKAKLKRFCYLGSFHPVYMHLRGPIAVDKYWPIVSELVKQLSDEVMLPFLKDILNDNSLVRRDEVLFVYAVYLASEIDIKWKTTLRIAFAPLMRTDDDLFLFCDLSMRIAKLQNHKGFSRTVRKAIKAWYEMQTPDAIRTMWMAHRGLHGFTHKSLIKLCHISDGTLGSTTVSTLFFKTCTELLKETETEANAVGTPPAMDNATANEGGVSTDTNANETKANNLNSQSQEQQHQTNTQPQQTTTQPQQPNPQPPQSNATSNPPTSEDLATAVSKLRITKKNHDALKIIRKYKLPYQQVPGHFLSYAPIMAQLIPTMSYMQVLKCWRRMGQNKHLENQRIFKLCKARLENKELARKTNVHPVHILINMHNIGVISGDMSKLPSKKVESYKMDYLDKLYRDSFQWQSGVGKLRMHITVNLQSNYKKKFLKNHRKLTYFDACLALSFGYSKREALVDVFHWYEDKMKLKKIVFEKDYTTHLGFTSYAVVENQKNNQRLVTPILNALSSQQVYDVFLCIVPTAGRGNPNQNSEFLCKFLDKYRETKNPKAKFIILDLLRFKPSMSYSETRNENILEICGLDEHTPDLIHNFATQRFE
uniref:TROVE domain-containing protein n=1 Tax=Stomoxys calcitrans TaxID=35570 RepID=A0A1I8Q4U4_STOCA